MSVRRDDAESSDRSPLMSKKKDKISRNVTWAQNAADNDDTQKSENDNPLMKGILEVAAWLHWLLPPVGVGIFLDAADQAIIVSRYGCIGPELHAFNSTSWIATAYFLTLTSFQPFCGKLSDIFERKPRLLFSYTELGIVCLACGLARSMPELIASRTFAGVGGGRCPKLPWFDLWYMQLAISFWFRGMTPVVSIMMSGIIPLRDWGTWQGYIDLIYASRAASGAPFDDLLFV